MWNCTLNHSILVSQNIIDLINKLLNMKIDSEYLNYNLMNI